MTIEGGCLCGAVRFTADEAPSDSVVCHCRSCRKASAAPSVGWLTFPLAAVTLTGPLRTFASSPGVVRSFCAQCGSPVGYRADTSPTTIDVTTLSLDQPERFPPTREIWLEQKLSWEAIDPARGRYPRDSAAGAARDSPVG